MTEENNEEILELDPEQLQELLGSSDSADDKLPPIVIDVDDYKMDDFKRGIDETSYDAGVIVALLNTGVSEQFVLDFLLSKATIDYNLKAAQINKETSVEVSKNQRLMAEKHEL